MVAQEDISYSREETVASFTSFYELLQKMYLPDGQVIHPPPGGWPSIVNAEPTLVEAFGKSQEVVALLAHLPYIQSQGDWNDDPDAFPGRHFADWQYHSDYLNKRVATDDSDDSGSPAPLEELEHLRRIAECDLYDLGLPHIVGIALNSDEDATVIVLDTERGVILWDESTCPRGVCEEYGEQCVGFDDPGSDDEMEEEEETFRQSSWTWAIPDFFGILKKQFLTLRWVPSSQFAVRSDEWSEGLPGEKNMTATCQRIFRSHGWPGLERYSKSECLAEVKETMEEHYDDYLDHRS